MVCTESNESANESNARELLAAIKPFVDSWIGMSTCIYEHYHWSVLFCNLLLSFVAIIKL
jgi:hypothetical protein